MKALLGAATIAREFDRLLKDCKKVSFAVAWAGTSFDEFNCLKKYQKKINIGVVGLHFYQTSPSFIREFAGSSKVRFITMPSGIFHPKIYYFDLGGNAKVCIVGSANFTQGGFKNNTEIAVRLSEQDGDIGKFFDEIDLYFNHRNSKEGRHIDIDKYSMFHRRALAARNNLSSIVLSANVSKRLDQVPVLCWTWDEFYSKVRNEPREGAFKYRTNVIRGARDLFRKHRSFGKMKYDERKLVAGLLGDESGWFGSMGRAIQFVKIVTKSPDVLSTALDCIPIDGPVTKERYMAYIAKFKEAFVLKKNGTPRGHGLATATRLLAMKRPDYFLCRDGANIKEIKAEFGMPLGHHQYDRYWDTVLAPVHQSEWWNSTAPDSSQDADEHLVWSSRVAFLDALFYNN